MMLPTEYCLFWIDWWPLCMTRSDWATWVQAIGSIAAILAAILIAYQQHKTQAMKEAAKAKLRAEVAATSILLQINPVIGAFASARHVIDQARKSGSGMSVSPQFLRQSISEAPLPNDRELESLIDHDPACVVHLVRAISLARQAVIALDLLADNFVGPLSDPSFYDPIYDVLGLSMQELETGAKRLDLIAPATAVAGQ